MKYGYVERAVKFCAPATRISTCWHMHRSKIILSVCHFRISRFGASNAMHIWMFLLFQSSTPYIELLMSQSSAISLVFQVRYQKLEQELPVPPDKANGTGTIPVTSHNKLQLLAIVIQKRCAACPKIRARSNLTVVNLGVLA